MRRPPSSILIDYLETYTQYSVPGARTFLQHLNNKNVASISLENAKWTVQFVKPSSECNVFTASEFDGEFVMGIAEELVRAGAMRRGTNDRETENETPFYVARLPNLDTLRLSKNSLHWKSWAYPIPTLDTLEIMGTLTRDLAALFRAAVGARKTIIVAGSSGSGKTTLVNALAYHAYHCRPKEVLFVDERANEIFLPPDACIRRAPIIELDRLCSHGGGLVATNIDRQSFWPAMEVARRCEYCAFLEATSVLDAIEVLDHLRGHLGSSLNHAIDYIVVMAGTKSSGSKVGSISSVWQVRLDWECTRIDFKAAKSD
jgi:hypothetical protein